MQAPPMELWVVVTKPQVLEDGPTLEQAALGAQTVFETVLQALETGAVTVTPDGVAAAQVGPQVLEEAPSETHMLEVAQTVALLVLQADERLAVVVVTAAVVAWQVLDEAPIETQVALGPQTIPASVWHALD